MWHNGKRLAVNLGSRSERSYEGIVTTRNRTLRSQTWNRN